MTEDLRAQITRRMADVGSRLRVKSALNPVLWLCAVVTVPVTGFATFCHGAHLADRLLGRARVHPIGFGSDKLQSEEYQIRKRTLEMIGEKGQEVSLVDLVEAARLRLTNKDDHD